MRLRAVLACLLVTATPARATLPDAVTKVQVDRMFGEWQRAAHIPGLVYGIVADGQVAYVKAIGVQDVATKRPVTPDSLFRIASMSKAFTALAVLKLRDEGRLTLDAPAETLVPELKAWGNATADSPRITLRNLLTHSAGFVEDNPWGDRQQPLAEADFTRMLKSGVPLSRAPGLAMEYSNFGYATLGRIITNVSGMPYQAYIRRTIMAPLGMTATRYDVFASPIERRALGYRWHDSQWVREPDMADGAFGAMGGIETSARDYAKWVAFLLAAWPARDGADTGPVRRATVREIVTGANFASGRMRNPKIGGAPCRQSVAYGMAWRVIDDCDLGRVVTHGGGYPGYGSIVMLLPERGIGLFAFANHTYAGPSVPLFRAALALNAAGAIDERSLPVSAGLAAAYDAARAVWRTGDIKAAPLAGNMLLDQGAGDWTARLAGLKADAGVCAANEAIEPISAMEGHFAWTCEHGRITGRVQQAPTPALSIQALEFDAATP